MNTVIRNDQFNYYFFYLLFLVYAFAAFILNGTGFAIASFPIFVWTILIIFASGKGLVFTIPKPILFFSCCYSIYTLISFSFWNEQFDGKDILAAYLFFVIIPLLIVNLPRQYRSSLMAIEKSLPTFFILISSILFFHAIRYGINWDRAILFGNSAFNKNGISAIYEILFIYVLFKQKGKNSVNQLIIIAIGLIGLATIGSKTSIAISLLFILGFYNKKVFYLGLVVIISALTYYIVITVDIKHSNFRTAAYRPLLWNQAIDESFANTTTTVIGNGPGTFSSHIREFGLYRQQSTHNYVIQLLHNYGLVGLSIFLIFFFMVYLRIGWWSHPASVAFWTFNLHSLFDVGWVKGVGFFISLILGIAIFYTNQSMKDHEIKSDLMK